MEHKSLSYSDRVLTASRLRSMLKKRRTRLVPEALATYLRCKVPEIYNPEAEEIRAILEEVCTVARNELATAGILPAQEYRLKGRELAVKPEQRLGAREREHLADLTALLTWLSEASVMAARSPNQTKRQEGEEVIALAKEAIAWGVVAEDRSQLAIALLVLSLHLEHLDNEATEARKALNSALALIGEKRGRKEKYVRLNCLYALATSFEFRGEFEHATEVISQGLAMVEPGSTPFERNQLAGLIGLQSQIARKRMAYRDALELGQQALRWSDPEYDPLTHCKILQYLGLMYDSIEHQEEGLKMLLEAITILESHGIGSTGCWVYTSAAQRYRALGEYERAHNMLDRIEKILHYPPNFFPDRPDRILIDIHGSRALIYVAQKEYRLALKSLDWIIRKYHEEELPNGEMSACAIAATAWGEEGNPEKACEYLERAIGLSDQASRQHQLLLHLRLATWSSKANQDQKANNLLDEIEPELKQHPHHYIRLLRLRAQLCEKHGNLAEAIGLERTAAEIEREALESKRERSMRYSRMLAEANLLEKIIEREKVEKQRLEHELASMVVELGEKKNLIDDALTHLKEELSRAKGERSNGRASIMRVYSILSSLQKRERGPGALLSHLGGSGEAFSRQLRLAYPNLTNSQERLCVLLHAGLSAKEICTLLGIGTEALKARRKRLRKTFKLQRGESLERCLATIAENG